jgi:hypothetical protein
VRVSHSVLFARAVAGARLHGVARLG